MAGFGFNSRSVVKQSCSNNNSALNSANSVIITNKRKEFFANGYGNRKYRVQILPLVFQMRTYVVNVHACDCVPTNDLQNAYVLS